MCFRPQSGNPGGGYEKHAHIHGSTVLRGVWWLMMMMTMMLMRMMSHKRVMMMMRMMSQMRVLFKEDNMD